MAFLRSLLRCGRKRHAMNDTTPLLSVIPVIEQDDVITDSCMEEKETDASWMVVEITQEQKLMSAVSYLQGITDSEKNRTCRNNLTVCAFFVIGVGAAAGSLGHYVYSKNTFYTNLDIFAMTNSMSGITCMNQYNPYYEFIRHWGFSGLVSSDFEEYRWVTQETGQSIFLVGPNIKDIFCYKTFYDIANGPGMFLHYGFLLILIGCAGSLTLCLACSELCRPNDAFDPEKYREDIKKTCEEYKIDVNLPLEAMLKQFQSLLNEFQLRREVILDLGKGLGAHGLFKNQRLTQIVCEYAGVPDPTRALLKSSLSL